MASALAVLANVQERVIQILNANQSAFATTVSGTVGAFPYDAEVNLAILEADEMVCTSGYFQSVNDSLANPFVVTSVPLADRDNVPWHHGTIKAVEVSKVTLNLTSASVNTTTDIITSTAHGMATGDMASFVIVSGGLPSPLAVVTNYFAIVLTANTFQLATTYGNAVYAGTAIDLTTTGSGRWILIDWITGVEAANIDDITNANAVGDAYVEAGAFDFLYKEDTGTIYTTANYCRASYPEYIRTSALQTRQAEEFLDIATAIRLLTKNASPARFDVYTNESIRGIAELVQDGRYTQQADSQQGAQQ